MEGQRERSNLANEAFLDHMEHMADGPAYANLTPAEATEAARRELTRQLLDGEKEFAHRNGIHIHAVGSESSCRFCTNELKGHHG